MWESWLKETVIIIAIIAAILYFGHGSNTYNEECQDSYRATIC